MDKWKDIELEKMKAGGNRNAREFFEDQPDWNERAPITQRYNSKAAALYRDKIATLAQGKSWNQKDAEERLSSSNNSYSSSSSSNYVSSGGNSSQNRANATGYGGNAAATAGGGYQNGGGAYSDNQGYQQFQTQEFKDQKEEFFSRRQQENASRPAYVYTPWS